MANIRLPQSSPAIGMPGVPRLPDPPASPDTSQYVGAALSGIGKMLDAHAKDSEKRAISADALLLTSMGYEAEVESIFSGKINPIVQDDNGVVDMLATIKQSEQVISNYVPLLEEAASEALEYLDGIDLMGKHTKDKLKAEINSVLAAGIGDEKAAHRKYRNIADEALVGLTIQGLERETQKALDGDNLGDLTKSIEGANSLSSTLNDPALRKELRTSLAKVDSNLKSGITASVSNKINAINDAEQYEGFPEVRRLIKNKEDEWISNAKALINSKPRGSGDGYWPPDLSEKESKAFSENPELASYLKRVEASRLPGIRAKELVGILFSPNGPDASNRDLYRANVKAIDEESEERYLEKGNMMRAIKVWGVMGVIPNKPTTPKLLDAIEIALNDNKPDEEDMDFILWASENWKGLEGLGKPMADKLEDFADKVTRRIIQGDQKNMLSAWITSEKIPGTEKAGKEGPQVRVDKLRLQEMIEGGFLESGAWWDGEGRNILEEAFEKLFPFSPFEGVPYGPSGLPESVSYEDQQDNREKFEGLVLDHFMSTLTDHPDSNQVAILNNSIHHIKTRVFQKSHGGRMEVMRYGERQELDVPILNNYLRNRLSNNAVTAEGWTGSREEYIDSIYETGQLVPNDLNGRTNAYYYELEDGSFLSDKTTPGIPMLIIMWGAKRAVLDPKWLSDKSEVKESIGGAVGPFPVHELSPLLEEEYKELPVPEQIKVFESAIARGGNLEDGPWENRTVEDILGLESWSSLDPEFKSSVIGHILSNEKEKREQQPFITNPVTRKYFEEAVKEISRTKRPRRGTRGAGPFGSIYSGGSMSTPSNPVWTDALTQEAVIKGMELFEKYELADVSPKNLAKLRDRIHLAGFKFDPEEAINGAGTTSYIVNEVLKGGWSPYVPGKNLVSSVIKTVGVTMRERRDRPWINEAMDGQESSYFAWEGGRKRNPKHYSVAGILSRRVKGVPVDNGPWPELALLKGSNGKLTKANVVSWLSDNDLPTEVGASSPLNAFDLIRAEASGLFMEPDARLIFAMSDTQFVRLLSGLIEEEEK
jgi:hypothetical protein